MNNINFTSPKNMAQHFLKPYLRIFVILFIMIPLSVICTELVFWYFARIINLINSGGDRDVIFNKIIYNFMLLVFCVIAAPLLDFLFLLLLQYKCIGRAGVEIRKELFTHILYKDWQFWNKHSAGEIWGKIDLSRRIIAAYSSIGEIFNSAYRSFCMVVVTLFLLYRIYPLLSVIFAIVGGITLFIFNHLSQNIKKPSSKLDDAQAKMLGFYTNLISNFFTLKTFGSETREYKEIYNKFDKISILMQKYMKISKINMLALKFLSLLFECILLLVAVYLLVNRKIGAGDIVFVMTSTIGFAERLDSFGWLIPFLKSRHATLEKNIQIFNTETILKDTSKKLKITEGKIEIKNLTFGYNANKNIIKNLTLTIGPKEKIGIVGLSGCGKTTLLHLLLRLINTPKNSIFIDGQDICNISQKSLHDAISFIPQDTTLFHRSIMENLEYGQFNATSHEIKTAAKNSFSDIFISSFPLKYNTVVGDKGIKLSGGERQRIGIARAFLRNSPILLLDEATSALDSESEDYIQKSIQNIMQNKIIIVVAHRLATLKNMDRIIVIDDGKIIEQGTPAQLLDKQGKFAKLWNLQKG